MPPEFSSRPPMSRPPGWMATGTPRPVGRTTLGPEELARRGCGLAPPGVECESPPRPVATPMPESIWYLKRCPLFEHLSPEECRRLETRARARTFPKKAVIYFPDQSGESVLLLARGRVKILSLTPGGRETIFAFIEPGELFGELAVLDAAPRNEYAEAVEESVTLAIPREDLLAMMGTRPDLAMAVTKLIGLRRRRVETRLRNLLFRTTRERTAAVLLELLETHGRP